MMRTALLLLACLAMTFCSTDDGDVSDSGGEDGGFDASADGAVDAPVLDCGDDPNNMVSCMPSPPITVESGIQCAGVCRQGCGSMNPIACPDGFLCHLPVFEGVQGAIGACIPEA